jgi:hypothetical protein
MAVGEGHSEDQWLACIGGIYVTRFCGVSMHRKNAYGFGGAHALEVAIDLKGSTTYDAYAVVVDTDEHWGAVERARAAAHDIVVIEHAPCLEAVLLDVAGQRPLRRTPENKRAFKEHFGDCAHRSGLLARKFDRDTIDSARTRIEPVDSLLRLIKC